MPPTADAINQEVDYVKEQIDDRAGPKTLALMLCVTDYEVQRHVQEYIGDSPGSKIVVESNRARYQTRIDSLSASGAKRLIIIFSTDFNARLSIQSEFTSCEIVCCNGSHAHLSEDSTYCGIRLGLWNIRRTYTSHNLLAHPYVYFEMVEPDVPETLPPYQFSGDDRAFDDRAFETRRAAQAIASTMTKGSNERNIDFLAWLAGIAGVISTGTALVVTKFNIGVKGIYISCQTRMCNVTVMPYSVTASASAAAGFGISVGAGIAVAAAVYFVPWKKLATLMGKAWDHFVRLMGYLWKFLGEQMEVLTRFICTVAVVLQSIITGVVDGVAQCITEFISFVGNNFPSIATMDQMLLNSSRTLGKSFTPAGSLKLSSSLFW